MEGWSTLIAREHEHLRLRIGDLGVRVIWSGSPTAADCATLIATLQGGDLTPGLINANTGWGSDCNPYGANGVFTATISGAAADYAFSVIIP